MGDFDFLYAAYAVAQKSKDDRTQVGACIVDDNFEIRSNGYNGPCRGEDDTNLEFYKKPLKKFIFEHAERNAIYNLAREGVAGKGCKIYCTLFPCHDCARAIIQVGITEVIMHLESPGADFFNESQMQARAMFDRLGIIVRYWSGKIGNMSIRCDGVTHEIL